MPDLWGIDLVVAAGGRGTRLSPITHGACKSLVYIEGKPLLYWALERIACDKISTVVIVSNPDSLETCLDVASRALPEAYIVGITQHNPCGTFDALQIAVSQMVQYNNFMQNKRFLGFLLGDNIPIKDAIKKGLPLLLDGDAVFFSRWTKRAGSSARVFRNIMGKPEKLKKPNGLTTRRPVEICCGLYLYRPWIWQAVCNAPKFSEVQNGEWNIDYLNNQLLRYVRVNFYKNETENKWLHINTPDDFVEASHSLRLT